MEVEEGNTQTTTAQNSAKKRRFNINSDHLSDDDYDKHKPETEFLANHGGRRRPRHLQSAEDDLPQPFLSSGFQNVVSSISENELNIKIDRLQKHLLTFSGRLLDAVTILGVELQALKEDFERRENCRQTQNDINSDELCGEDHGKREPKFVVVAAKPRRRKSLKMKEDDSLPLSSSAGFEDALSFMSEDELRNDIEKFEKYLIPLSYKLPDGAAKLKARLRSLKEELERRQNDRSEEVSVDEYKNCLFRVLEPLLVGPAQPQQRPRGQSSVEATKDDLPPPSSALGFEDVSFLSDTELKNDINRFEKFLLPLSAELPDGGAKLRARLRALKEEFECRQNRRSQEVAVDEYINSLLCVLQSFLVPIEPLRRARWQKSVKASEDDLPSSSTFGVETVSSMYDDELKNNIDEVEKSLLLLCNKLPDGGAKLKAKLQPLKEEFECCQNCHSRETLKWRKSVKASEDDPLPSSSAFGFKNVSSMSDAELRNDIDRVKRSLLQLRKKLPDGGAKLKAKLRDLKEELEWRQNCHSREKIAT